MKIILLLVLGLSFLFGSVDINSAGVKELTTLKGIGAKKAEAIVIYRKSNCFQTVDELVKVKGIAQKTLEKNRANLTATKCKN